MTGAWGTNGKGLQKRVIHRNLATTINDGSRVDSD